MDINIHNTHILNKFEYYAPVTVAEATKLLAKYGENVAVLAGGTDLIVRMKHGTLRPKYIINLKKIDGLEYLEEKPEGIQIGALTKIRDIERSLLIQKKFPVLHEAAKAIGSVQIRNLATVGGNICRASPCSDCSVALLALDAVAHTVSSSGERKIPLESFFAGPGKTVLEKDEILLDILIPKKAENFKGYWLRVARASMDIATISLALSAKVKDGVVEDCRIAWGTCGPTPMRTKDVEVFLKGKKLTDGVIEDAARLASKSIKPREVGRSRGLYKRKVASGYLMEALTKLSKSEDD